ncbi:MAG: hypothetical protein NTX64_13540 [Elusimicrobia bacterium]|nr:hypothetical protein [Elusimicrobiota bacterium]
MLFTCGLLLAAQARPAAAADDSPQIFFDQAGSLDGLLRALKEDAASASRRAAPPVGEAKAVTPILVTVCGLEFSKISIGGIEYDDLVAFWKKLFPDRPVKEEEIRAEYAEMQAMMHDTAAPAPPKPDDYLAQDLAELARKAGVDVEIVNFAWSRDPKDTERTADSFAQKLLALRDAPATRGRPLYIAAHSWGTVLIYEALMRLQLKEQIIEVPRLVTLGSPLVPSRLWVRLFKEKCNHDYHLQRSIVKPQGVRQWENLWAALDPYSNTLTAADRNDRVDLPAVPYEEKLIALLKTAQDKKAVKADLAALRNSGRWHFSYILGFKAALPTIGADVCWDIPRAYEGQMLPACSAPPASHAAAPAP